MGTAKRSGGKTRKVSPTKKGQQAPAPNEDWLLSPGHAEGIEAVTTRKLDDLTLDPRNPRLPDDPHRDSQDEILAYIAKEFRPIEVARSIARHGFFPSEPLIVVRESGKDVVVEGNRRLVALLLLANPARAVRLKVPSADEWKELAKVAEIPDEVPVIIAESRSAVAPIIGYRHISGILPWKPREKAKYIATFVDVEGHSFPETGSLVGESERAVRELYRNYHVAEQLRRDFGIDTAGIVRRFGVFTRAMQDERIREFIGAPHYTNVKKTSTPLPNSKKGNAADLVLWVFGDDTLDPRIDDSRDLTRLGEVIASDEALQAYREGASLDEAFERAGGVKAQLLRRLERAGNSLEKSVPLVANYASDPEVKTGVRRCELELSRIQVQLR